jgi:hypothetical protein
MQIQESREMFALLSEPQIISCDHEDIFQPQSSVMMIDWRDDPRAARPRVWDLPGGIMVCSPAPVRFGLFIQRRDVDHYAVRLIWNHMSLSWQGLERRQLQDCCLHSLLAAIGTDLEYLLEQPVIESQQRSSDQARQGVVENEHSRHLPGDAAGSG